MNDAILAEDKTSSYKGEVPGTFSGTEKPVTPQAAAVPSKIGMEIVNPQAKALEEARKKLLREGELLAKAGIILKTDASGETITGMILPPELLAQELINEQTEKDELKGEIEKLQKTVNSLQGVQKEYDELMAKMKTSTPEMPTEEQPAVTTESAKQEQAPESDTSTTVLRSPLATSTPRNWMADKSTEKQTPSTEEKDIPDSVDAMLSDEVGTIEATPNETVLPVVEKTEEVKVETPVQTETKTMTEEVKSQEIEQVPEATPAVIEQLGQQEVQNLQDILIKMRGDDWKKYMIQNPAPVVQTAIETVQPEEAKQEQIIVPEEMSPEKQLSKDIIDLDVKTFVSKHIKSEDSAFVEKILKATCHDILTKETEIETTKSIFGDHKPKGITVDVKGIDHRLELRGVLLSLSNLDKEDYSSETLTVGDFIASAKTNLTKANNN